MNKRIKELRMYLKLTQPEFGSRVGVKGNTIGNYEVGLRNPSDAVIFSICREFKVNESWLRSGEGEMFVSFSIDDEDAIYIQKLIEDVDRPVANLIKDIAVIYEKLDDSGKDFIDQMLLELVARSAARKNEKEES